MEPETIHRAPKSVNKGLEGSGGAGTRVRMVDGEAGELIIAGFPVAELAMKATFEETVWLLWHGDLPDATELAGFQAELAARRKLSAVTTQLLAAAAHQQIDPIDALRLAAGTVSLRKTYRDREDALNLVAIFPTIVAAYWRLSHGQTLIEPRADLPHAPHY